MRYNEKDRDEYRKQQQQAAEARITRLAETWKEDPAQVADYLRFSNQFHKYSARNHMLMYAQNPHVTFAAKFKDYEAMGYHIRKGEHGMKIYAPTPKTYFRITPQHPWVPITAADELQKHQIKIGMLESRQEMHYKIGTVFDITQTTCPLEDYPKILGLGYHSEQHAELYTAVSEYCESIGMPVSETSQGLVTRGLYSPRDHHIEINTLLGDTQKLSTVFHEMSHGIMEHGVDMTISTAQIEFEADALAIMLEDKFGIPITDARQMHLAQNFKAYLGEMEANGIPFEPERVFGKIHAEYQTHSAAMKTFLAERGIFPQYDPISQTIIQTTPQNAPTLDRQRVFVDMDGTIANFHENANYLERMYEKGYFEQLAPYPKAVDGIKECINAYPNAEVYILTSTIDSPTCIAEKNAWLDKHLPEVDAQHRIFVPIGESKTEHIAGGVKPTDILLDDYNKNLAQWQSAGGTPIKFVNDINDHALHGERWNGTRIYHTQDPKEIAGRLRSAYETAVARQPLTAPTVQQSEQPIAPMMPSETVGAPLNAPKITQEQLDARAGSMIHLKNQTLSYLKMPENLQGEFVNCTFHQCDFSGSSISATFDRCVIQEPITKDAVFDIAMKNSELTHARIYDATFLRASFEDAVWNKVTLKNTCFDDLSFARCRMDHVIVDANTAIHQSRGLDTIRAAATDELRAALSGDGIVIGDRVTAPSRNHIEQSAEWLCTANGLPTSPDLDTNMYSLAEKMVKANSPRATADIVHAEASGIAYATLEKMGVRMPAPSLDHLPYARKLLVVKHINKGSDLLSKQVSACWQPAAQQPVQSMTQAQEHRHTLQKPPQAPTVK